MNRQKSDKLCECGCGQFTNLALSSSAKIGMVKGQPMRFVRGHSSNGTTPSRKHYATKNRKPIHRLRAEAALGRSLPLGAEVHHIDGTKDPNGQLVICENRFYHMLLHARMKVVRAGGNPNTQFVCSSCKELKMNDELFRGLRCRSCYNKYQRQYRGYE